MVARLVETVTRDPAADADAGQGRARPPGGPDEVVEVTRARYVEVYERLTGARWLWPAQLTLPRLDVISFVPDRTTSR